MIVGPDGGFDFTPAAGFNGTFSFEYRIGNPSGASDALATIVVQAAATAVDDDAMVFQDDPATAINVLGNDTDLGVAVIGSVTQPANGTVVNTVTGLTFQPDPGFCNDGAPTDDFTYTLIPGGSTATVAMTVSCVQTVVLGAARDNTIYSEGDVSNGAGIHMFAGRAGPQNPPNPTAGPGGLRRALIGFDIEGNIQPGSVIRKVVLTLHSSTHSHGEGPQAVALHRLVGDWGEGTTDAPDSEGHGAAANPGDVTWQHTFFPNSFWGVPGGDFNPVLGAVAVIPEEGQDGEGGQGDERPHDWGSTAEMVANVQAWLDNPGENYGWILIGNELEIRTAKRFETRHTANPALRPSLMIRYTPPN